MKYFLGNFFITLIILHSGSIHAKEFNTNYIVSTSGIKIGEFNWLLNIDGDEYKTEIYLKNNKFLSALYNFEGRYLATGTVENKVFKSKKYEQNWRSNKRVRVIKMSFDDYLINLFQKPTELEEPRINLNELIQYTDPITSFINILNGHSYIRTIDGRRVYTMYRKEITNNEVMVLEIKNYKNIWADHKRNDLKKIEFLVGENAFLPEKIMIYFKKRVFVLKRL